MAYIRPTINELRAEIERRDAKIAALVEALKKVEWVYDPEWERSFCPSCHIVQGHSHAPDCQVAAALKLAD